MLVQLRVGNLTLVDDLSLKFHDGLTILTGETGAGKSLIAGALSLLAGAKADRGLIRHGEDLAYVEGVFDLSDRPQLSRDVVELGLSLAEDRLLVLRRELRREGRGRVLINGLISSLALLEQVGPRLLSVQSQDQQRVLSKPGFALEFLDHALGHQELRRELSAQLTEFRGLTRVLQQRLEEEEFARQQMEIWEYQARELGEAGLELAEESRLAEQIALGRNARGLMEGAAKARQVLIDGEANARQMLGAAYSALAPLSGSSPRLDSILDMIQEAQSSSEEAAADLERFVDGMDLDPAKLDELEARHSLYSDLQRKYQRDVAGLLDLQESLEKQIKRQAAAASDLVELKDQLEQVKIQVSTLCRDLHDQRVAGQETVAREACRVIRPLALKDLELAFEVGLRSSEDGEIELDGKPCAVTDSGADRVTMLARTNPGESFGDVGKIASGGEKSRIFLGLSVMAGDGQEQPLLLFDEIDAGLGMDNAVPVAQLLEKLAASGQVLCITHLPTVAAHGSQHLQVAKQARDGRTTVRVALLTDEDRVDEVARLLGGEMPGPETNASQTDYARKLLSTRYRLGEG